MFRRKSAEAEAATETVIEDEPVEPIRPKSYTPKKGEATPKRVVSGRRPVSAAPATRKEALARARDKQRQDRDERRKGMLAGDERYLLPRDRGPVRAIARDVVDSRYNVGSFFIYVLVLILIASFGSMPVAVKSGANLLFVVMILALVVDSVFVLRKVRRLVRERHPDAATPWPSLFFYTVMRSISFRSMRVPKPRVRVGDQI